MKKINKESYEYYKIAYRANKKYHDTKGDDDYGKMLSENEWKDLHANLSTKQIVYNQFHFYSKDVAEKIQKSLKIEGFKVSIKTVQARNYSNEMYESIKKTYADLKLSMSTKEAAQLISYTYYGS